MKMVGACRGLRSATIAACAVAFFAIGCESKNVVDPQFDDEAAIRPESEALIVDLQSNPAGSEYAWRAQYAGNHSIGSPRDIRASLQ